MICIIVRKLFSRRLGEKICFWNQLGDEVKTNIKNSFFTALISEQNAFLKLKITDLVSEIAEEVFD